MTRTLVALALTLTIGGLLTFVSPYHAVTPGALSAGHERLSNDCFACHAPLGGPTRAKCLSCHTLDRLGLQLVNAQPRVPARPRSRLIHQALVNERVECYQCHLEHTGASRAAAIGTFTHAVLTADLRPQCLSCHAADAPKDSLHAGLTTVCSACHASDRWKPASFEHDRYFRFDARHPSRCGDCHTTPGNLKTYTCYGCHAHTPANVADEHRRQRGQALDQCARCHRTGSGHDAKGGESGDRPGRESEGDRRRPRSKHDER
ncbi:MAG: hypothetical protein WCP29_09535 [Acidobacteriota bacterium]